MQIFDKSLLNIVILFIIGMNNYKIRVVYRSSPVAVIFPVKYRYYRL